MSDTKVHLTLPGDLLARLDERALREFRSRTNMALHLIAEGLRREEAK